MSFFKSRTGAPITGSEEHSFSTNLRHLPDNTQAPAVIKRVSLQEYQGENYYSIIWQLVDGDFKGAEVKQTLKPFDKDDNKAQRDLNMMFRIFTIGSLETEFENMPTNNDLAPLKGQIMAIKAGNGIIQGTERTWVREVWKEGELDTCTGETQVVTSKPSRPEPETAGREDSAFDRERKRKEQTGGNKSLEEEDIPF